MVSLEESLTVVVRPLFQAQVSVMGVVLVVDLVGLTRR
jgi:hypothetical protein